MPNQTYTHDVVVVGGGPSGMSCALECHENALDVAILEREARVGGQVPSIPSPISNYAAGFFESGEKLREQMEAVAHQFLSDRIKTECEVLRVDLGKREIETNRGIFKGKAIFLATGYRVRRLEFPVESRFEKDILYRSGPSRESFPGQSIVIIGSGDSAVFTALDLSRYCSHITVLARGDRFKARPDIVAKMKENRVIEAHTNSVVTRLAGQEKLESVKVSNGSGEFEVKCEKLIAKLGYLPNTELFSNQLDCSDGHIIVNQQFETSLAGIFAGGDIVQPGYDRIAFAAGSGMMAARSIRVFLGHTP